VGLKYPGAIPIIYRHAAAPMTADFPSQRVESPCIKVCVLDEQSICVGCGRTLEEIAVWSRASAEEQRAICAAAAERLVRAGVRISARSR
jgi:predicted Fe-S protein YdhL (DUF1289 family)